MPNPGTSSPHHFAVLEAGRGTHSVPAVLAAEKISLSFFFTLYGKTPRNVCLADFVKDRILPLPFSGFPPLCRAGRAAPRLFF